MQLPDKKNQNDQEEESDESSLLLESDVAPDENDDGTPILDEEDLEENDLTDEEAENIVWEEPKQGKGSVSSSSSEEKDITD